MSASGANEISTLVLGNRFCCSSFLLSSVRTPFTTGKGLIKLEAGDFVVLVDEVFKMLFNKVLMLFPLICLKSSLSKCQA
jgi:hypothetical protein